MAWSCTGRTNLELVNNLANAGLLSTPRAIEAFKRVDRKYYVAVPFESYVDSPSYLSYGATISAPHMHANAVENLESFLQPGANVLDVGSGSGYLLGIFHSLVQPGGSVLGIDHIPGLVSLARENLAKDPTTAGALCEDDTPPAPGGGGMRCIVADGREGAPEGYVPEGGWQAIHVGAAAPHLPPALIAQLASPGRMFIPVGTHDQAIFQVDKDAEGRVTKKMLYGVRYVPLTDAEAQHPPGSSP